MLACGPAATLREIPTPMVSMAGAATAIPATTIERRRMLAPSLSSTGPAARAVRGSVVNGSGIVPISVTVRRVISTLPGVFGPPLDSCSSMTYSMLRSPRKMLREGRWLTAKCHPAAWKHPAYGQVLSGKLKTMGIAVLLTTTHRNDSWSEGLISICSRKAGTWIKYQAFDQATDSLLFPHEITQRPTKT